MMRAGYLPDSFAVPVGWSELLVAAPALAMVRGVGIHSAARRTAFLLWNLAGAMVLLVVIIFIFLFNLFA